MGFLKCQSCESHRHQISALLAQLSDRDELLLKLIEQHGVERKEILEKLLAIAHPGAVTELRRDPNVRADRPSTGPIQPNFPGLRRDLRPPVTPPQAPRRSGGEPADQEAADALDKAVAQLNTLRKPS